MVVIKARPEHKHEGLVTSLLAPTVDGIYMDNCPMKIKYFKNRLFWGQKSALFPCLPHFYLLFAFTIIYGSGRPPKMGKVLEHSSCE